MCGRYTLFVPPDELESRFDLEAVPDIEPRYNAAPGQELPVIRSDEPRTLTPTEWGFIPHWAEDPDTSHVNARVETVAEKPTFRAAAERRRCLVPADGFYEWPDDGQPHRIALEDDAPFAMAGIWERWTGTVRQTGLEDFGEGEPDTERTNETFAILTTDANAVVGRLHDRMPVILSRAAEDRWLDGAITPDEIAAPREDEDMRAYPVSTRVNSPANDDPDLVEPVDT